MATIKDKLDMTPAEAAHALVLTVLQDASCDMHALVDRIVPGRGYTTGGDGLTDTQVASIYRHYAKVHNQLADKAEKRFGLETTRL